MLRRPGPSTNQLSVFVTSCEVGRGAWTTNEEKLRDAYELSDRKYTLTENPQSADLIIIGDVREEDWGRKILQHELINKYPDKSFSLSDADHPIVLHHGIYASATKSIFNLGRVRTGSYTLYSDKYLNPYIKAHQFSGPNSIKKEYLLTFIGRNTFSSRRLMKVRDALFHLKFERPDVFIEDASTFNLWATDKDGVERRMRQKHYYEVLLRSKFSLCPRGEGANSLRLFESMQLGVAPVIVSDRWILPRGPKWHEFSIVIKERHIRHVERIVQAYETDYKVMGDLARKSYEDFFSDRVYFNYIVDNCIEIMRGQVISEAVCWRLNPLVISILKIRQHVRSIMQVMRSGVKRLIVRKSK
jgi:hypothetical protein